MKIIRAIIRAFRRKKAKTLRTDLLDKPLSERILTNEVNKATNYGVLNGRK